jgi:ketosteroid isomerase-like protein
MGRPWGCHAHACPASVLEPLLLALAPALLMATATACGGSATTAASLGSTPEASPSVATTPERLAGSDSVAVTQKTVDAYTAAWEARSVAQLGALYARDAVFHCFATGVHVDGRAALVKMLGDVCAMTTGARALAGHVGRGWAVLELRQDFAQGSVQLLELIETRGGKIVRHANYYQPVESQSNPLRVANPLRSAPGPADTPAASKAVALEYAAALQNKDAATVAALSAPAVAFVDTASGTAGSSPGDVQTHYDTIFKAPTDLAFIHVRYAFGRGWAAVIWTAHSTACGGDGVTMLEIRNGKIRRETLYYNSSNVPF